MDIESRSNTKANTKIAGKVADEFESIDRLFAHAVQHHRYGELSKAEALYQAILKRDPNHLAAMKKYGVLSFQWDDFLLAEKMFEQVYEMGQFDEQLSVNLVMSKIKLDKTAEALPVIHAILRHNPESKAAIALSERLQMPLPDLESC